MDSKQIQKSIHEIKRRYRIGQEILKAYGSRTSPDQILKFAEKYSINRDARQKLRAMASPKIGYTTGELKTLFEQFRQQGHALTISR